MSAPSASPRSLRPRLVLILLIALVNFACAIGWGLPSGESSETVSPWAVDTIAPVEPLNEAYHLFTRGGTDVVIYPLFHYVVLSGAFSPYVALQYLTGGLENPSSDYPYGAAEPAAFFKHLTLIARLVSLAMGLGIVLLLFDTTRSLFGGAAASWAALMAALLAPLAYYSTTSNLDVPYLFWIMLSIWALVRIASSGARGLYVLAGAGAGLAVATKDQAYGFVLAYPIIVPLLAAPRGVGVGRALVAGVTRREVWLSAASAALAYVAGNNLIFGWDGFRRHLDFLREFYDENFVELRAGTGAGAAFTDSAEVLVQDLGIGVCLFALIGIVLAVRRRVVLAAIPAAAVLTYFAAVVAVTTVLSRYLLGPMLLLLPFAGYAVAECLRSAKPAVRYATAAAAALSVAWLALLSAHLNASLLLDSRYRMEEYIAEHVPSDAIIESPTQIRYLPRIASPERYRVVGNSFSAVSYSLVADELTASGLAERRPDYVLILANTGLSGDPDRLGAGAIRSYFESLLAGELGYEVVARFETPYRLRFRQVTSGTTPTSILLRRKDGE